MTEGAGEQAPSSGGMITTTAARALWGAALGFVILGLLFGILAFSANLQQLHGEENGEADSENACGASQGDQTLEQASS